MSFLNSVLSSINSSGNAISVPQYKPKPKDASADPESPSTPSVPAKRKAEEQLGRASEKASKSIAGTSAVNSSTNRTRPQPISPSSNDDTFSKRAEKSTSNQPRNGMPQVQPVAPASTVPKAAPKKGSFAEILARAKQNQAIPVGTIVHKPKEKLSTKKELLLQKELAMKKKKGIPIEPVKGDGKMGHGPGQSKSHAEAKPNDKHPKSTGYQGTAKPKPVSTYQGTAKPKPQISYRGTAKSAEKPGSENARRRGYESEPERIRPKAATKPRQERYSDSLSEGEEEDGYEYASEDYSDMDAGFDDVDEEESRAEREAKKEDAYEAMMLEELKRQKEQRKRREMQAREREKALRR